MSRFSFTKLLLTSLAVAFFSFVPIAVTAQSQERVLEFTSNVFLDSDGRAYVKETILYDFGSNERQGIYRDIPLTYIVEGDQGYVLDVQVIQVAKAVPGESAATEPYILINLDERYQRIRIGTEGQFISGAHRYEIEYEIGPLPIIADNGKAIVRYDVPGVGFEVPVDLAQIDFEGPSAALRSTCYQGQLGATEQDCTLTDTGYRASSLAPGETLTAEYEYEADTFMNFARLQTIDTNQGGAWVGAIIIGLFSGLFGILAIRPLIGFVRHRQRRKQEVVYPRYEPPKDMTPAEIGLLIDNSSNGAEFSATIIDLAVRGYLKIKQTKEKKWWRSAEYEFIKLKDDAKLNGYEQDIFQALFEKGERVAAESLKTSTKFRAALKSFHDELKSKLTKRGFYKSSSVFAFDLASRMTEEGYDTWAQIEGFRDFLSVTQKDRLAFHDAPQKKPEQFSEFLPYAVALGVEKQWAQQFKDLDIKTDWYESSHGGFLVATDLSRMSNSISQVAASAVASSSGSSSYGGGFSGGGFSGGGGGSW